jgi:enterochelin esterase-like enzyme
MIKKALILSSFIIFSCNLFIYGKSTPGQSLVKFESIPAPSLKGNMLKDPDTQDISVYLPPSYYKTKKRYPVVYYLHGYYDVNNPFIGYTSAITDAMKRKEINEYIIVVPNGINQLMGCFYVNSPVTGNWEDYIVSDTVRYIDEKYRTIPKAESRGIAGFSMGGFGAINLALRHPEIFSAVFSISPGLFDEKGLKDALASGLWNDSFLQAYGAAFAPNLKRESPYADIPGGSDAKNDKAILEKWENGFGNLQEKINQYLGKKERLQAIRIMYGRSDAYEWIKNGCEYFSKLLMKNNIPHKFDTFDGGHQLSESIATKELAPFFSKNLKYE